MDNVLEVAFQGHEAMKSMVFAAIEGKTIQQVRAERELKRYLQETLSDEPLDDKNPKHKLNLYNAIKWQFPYYIRLAHDTDGLKANRKYEVWHWFITFFGRDGKAYHFGFRLHRPWLEYMLKTYGGDELAYNHPWVEVDEILCS